MYNMTLITFTTSQISSLRIAFEAIDSLLSDVLFVFTEKDIRIRDVDKTGTLLISATFETDKFDKYEYTHSSATYKIGIATDSIVKAIKTNLPYDVLTFTVTGTNGGECGATITLTSAARNETKTCVLKVTNVMASSDKISTMEYGCQVTINPTLLSKYIKDLNHVCECVEIAISNEALILKGIIDDKHGDEKTVVEHVIKSGSALTIDKSGDVKPSKKIPITSLMMLNKCVNLYHECYIMLSDALPLLVTYPLSSMGHLKIVYL
jgi:hypothetical protein